MTLLKIAQFGHPVLLRRADPVDNVACDTIQTLIDDMIETMMEAGGVGIAAPQVYRSLRMFVVKRVDLAEDSDLDSPPMVLINPTLDLLGDDMVSGFEGCLSIKGMRGLVPRRQAVRYEGMDRNGEPLSGEAQGFFARVLQHEYDHLDGILYPARLRDWRHMAADAEVQRLSDYLQPTQ